MVDEGEDARNDCEVHRVVHELLHKQQVETQVAAARFQLILAFIFARLLNVLMQIIILQSMQIESGLLGKPRRVTASRLILLLVLTASKAGPSLGTGVFKTLLVT